MPLKAFVCPDDPWTWRTITDCRACAEPCFGALEVVETLWYNTFGTEHHYHDDPKVISVTESLGCLSMAWFKKKREYAETPKSLMARTNGTNTHGMYEAGTIDGDGDSGRHAEGYHCEVPLDPIDLSHGYTFRGTVDRVTPDAIKDYKSCDNPTKSLGGPKRRMDDGTKRHVHAEQLSVYADALGHEGRLEVVQVGRRDAATHQAPRVENALLWAKERAETLIVALEADDVDRLDKEGVDILYYRACACNFCPFRLECGPNLEDG